MSFEASLGTRLSNYCDCFGLSSLFGGGGTYEDDGEEVTDRTAGGLSHVGHAAYEVLRKEHNRHHHTLWNVTRGTVVSLDPTPKQGFIPGETVGKGHSDWFPKKLGGLISQTEVWCDVTSLAPPDGLFMTCFKAALKKLHEKNKPITFRLLVGNIVGMPTNCNAVRDELTAGIPDTTKLRVWVGAWRKGVSWNHSKIIAVDGHILFTGGHNLWDGHYLQHDPVHDLSMQLEGRVAHDGHLYANEQWRFVQQMQNSIIGNFVDKLPDNLPFALKSRVTVSEFPSGGIASVFPPMYDRSVVKGLEGQPASTSRAPPSKKPPRREEEEEKEKQGHRGGRDHSPGRPGPGGHRRDDDENKKEDDERPGKPGPPPAAASPKKGEGSLIISMGRYGTLTSFNRRPADDAIIAMILSAKKAVRLALQDIGPVCIPGTKVPLPGTSWPKNYLSALGKVIWTKGVDVEIVLSNPASIPGGLSKMEACYGNGWSCSDVAAEIIKTMKEQFPSAADDESKLQNKLVNNLRVSFLRSATGQKWEDGMTLALHSKHMIVDESAYLVGSQNLYVCDLAEWGVVVDDEAETKKVLDEYWGPMWKASYTPDDCDVREVMEGLDKDRNGEDPTHVSEATQHLLDTPENKHLLNDGKGGAVVRPSMKNNKFFNEED